MTLFSIGVPADGEWTGRDAGRTSFGPGLSADRGESGCSEGNGGVRSQAAELGIRLSELVLVTTPLQPDR